MQQDAEKLNRWEAMIQEILVPAALNQRIYNVDYKEVKDLLNRLIEGRLRNIWAYWLDNGGRGNSFRLDSYWKNPYSNQLLGFIKCVDKDRLALKKVVGMDDEIKAVAEKTLKDLTLVAETIHEQYALPLMALKDKIVMGRKPSTDPKKTPDRTLEHTGTCGICGKNVKIEGTGLYHHGFTLQWQSRNGSCFGRGYKPIEISSDVLVDYIAKVVRPYIKKETELLSFLQSGKRDGTIIEITSHFRNAPGTSRFPIHLKLAKGEPMFDQVVNENINHHESNIRMGEMELANREQQLREWAPRPLPDAKETK